MRKAAVLILMVFGAYVLVNSVVEIILSISYLHSNLGASIHLYINTFVYVFLNVFLMVCGAFIVTGGVFCLKRRYWGLCLASGLIAALIGISPVVEALVRGIPLPLIMQIRYRMNWVIWLLVGGAVVSIIFIIRRRKEWLEI
jgi:hypothetical protein